MTATQTAISSNFKQIFELFNNSSYVCIFVGFVVALAQYFRSTVRPPARSLATSRVASLKPGRGLGDGNRDRRRAYERVTAGCRMARRRGPPRLLRVLSMVAQILLRGRRRSGGVSGVGSVPPPGVCRGVVTRNTGFHHQTGCPSAICRLHFLGFRCSDGPCGCRGGSSHR